MNVEHDLPSSFSATSAFEDFFNMDMLAGSSSRSSSGSPRLPPTPPAAGPDPSSFFSFMLDDDFTKPGNLLTAAPSSAPYDFLGAYGYQSGGSASPESAPPTISPQPQPHPLAIDPQLVDAPTPSKAFSDIDEDEERDDGDEHDGDDENVLEPVKVGGRGKQRKGTVQSGGVEKKSGGKHAQDRKTEELDDWRPSPEEYKKMSSKEKRQLRNKISARNFRVRRKGTFDDLSRPSRCPELTVPSSRSQSTSPRSRAISPSVTALSTPSVPTSVRPNPRTSRSDKRSMR